MGLNIDDPEVNRLVAEVAAAMGASETEAVRRSMLRQMESLALPSVEERCRQIRESLEREVWSRLPPEARGKPIPQEEQDEILGYGPGGYSEHSDSRPSTEATRAFDRFGKGSHPAKLDLGDCVAYLAKVSGQDLLFTRRRLLQDGRADRLSLISRAR